MTHLGAMAMSSASGPLRRRLSNSTIWLVPGAKELEALKRLTPAEVLARRAMLSYAPAGTYSYDDQQPTAALPLESERQTALCRLAHLECLHRPTCHHRRFISGVFLKLQIVKPIEGSQTLLDASGNTYLSGLLEERPGVTIRSRSR
ncbi:Trafficking kinesin-binding protein milt [Eumeta japonica]|uniref:Trafficking kinesin-binding protein milt n=1 Tax=Eumeta variegata TaxID=151549 RepID=A0A4C1TS51_EUMVA|nr:Trafficking kinesin-binding protein milt [Eumeta japonica]